MNRDTERFAGTHDAARRLDVGGARPGIAGGMVVDEDERGGAVLEGAAHDLARVDRRFADAAFGSQLLVNEAIRTVEEEDAQPLPFLVRHVEEEIVEQRLRIAQRRFGQRLGAERVQHGIANRAEVAGRGRCAGERVRPGRRVCRERLGKRAEAGDQPVGQLLGIVGDGREKFDQDLSAPKRLSRFW